MYFSGQLSIYLWFKKSHPEIATNLDFKLNLGIFFGTEEV